MCLQTRNRKIRERKRGNRSRSKGRIFNKMFQKEVPGIGRKWEGMLRNKIKEIWGYK